MNCNEGTVIALKDNMLAKINKLFNDIGEFVMQQVPNQINMGMTDLFQVSKKIENYLLSMIEKELGVNAEFVKSIGNSYIRKIYFANRPRLILDRKLVMDVTKIALQKTTPNEIAKQFRNELKAIIDSVKSGNDPFGESFVKKAYLVFEAEAAISSTVSPSIEGNASNGTLASFKGVLPVVPVSLVDTDGEEKVLIPKEVKKDHFVLKPTKEQLQLAILRNISNSKLSEMDYKRYVAITRFGNIKILKEHLTESLPKVYKRFGDSITISNITYKEK